MFVNDCIIRDCFRKHYRLYTLGSPPVDSILKAERFYNEEFTEDFVRCLDEPHYGFWRQLLNQFNEIYFKHGQSVERSVSKLLIQGTITLYHIKHLDGQFRGICTPDKSTTLPTLNGTAYKLAPASQLLQSESKYKTFNNKKEADYFLNTLEMDSAQQNALASAMNIEKINTTLHQNTKPNIQLATQRAAIAEALLKQQFVIIASPIKNSPQTNNTANTPVKNTPVTPPSLGPHDEPGYSAAAAAIISTANSEETETPPLCQRNSLTVSCSHGRSVTLGPDTAHMPNLDVIATSIKSKKKQADLITIRSDITDICPGHTAGHLIIGREEIPVTHQQPGKTSTIRVYANPLHIQSNPIKYAWLPKIKPKTYPIYPGTTCDGSKLKNAGKGILLNIYPKVAWDWGITLGYGKDQQKIEAGKDGSYTNSLSQKRFSIDGHIELSHDNETTTLSSEFKQAIDSTRQQLESITNLVDGVLKRFDEGKEPTVTVTWPNLKLNLKTELAEGKDQHRVVAFDFGISAAPFFGLDVKVDILPVLLAPLAGGLAGKKIIESVLKRIEKGVGDKEGAYSAEGTVSVIMTGKTSLSCEGHFKGDFSNNNRIEKVSGKPVEGKIEFSAEGIIDIKGHLLKIKIELVAGIGIKSSITLDVDIDKDDKGYYWQPQARFNGVKVYINKLVKTKTESGGENGFGVVEVNQPNLAVKETDEYVWIKEKTLGTNKHYFIEY